MINKLPTSSSFSITICWCEQIQAPCLVTLQSYWACWLLQSDSLICGAAYCLWDLACIRLDHPDRQDSGEGQSGLGLERTTHIFKCSDHMIVFPIEIQTLSIKLAYSRLNSMRLKVQPAQIPNSGRKDFFLCPHGEKMASFRNWTIPARRGQKHISSLIWTAHRLLACEEKIIWDSDGDQKIRQTQWLSITCSQAHCMWIPHCGNRISWNSFPTQM